MGVSTGKILEPRRVRTARRGPYIRGTKVKTERAWGNKKTEAPGGKRVSEVQKTGSQSKKGEWLENRMKKGTEGRNPTDQRGEKKVK